MKKNLILGAAKGYDWDTLEPFVFSCKKNCPSAELVFFVDDISDFTRAQLIRTGVLLKDFPAEMCEGVPNNTRWKVFSDFLEEHGDKYEQIFISDTRDVIFQSDVFECFKGYSNYLGYTTEPDDIRGSKTGDRLNYNWLFDFFGKEKADRLLDKKIICSGTVIGTSRYMQIFCREIWQTLKCNISGVFDQAVANYLIHENLLPLEHLIEIDVYSGEIFTSALFHTMNPVKIRGDKILRGDDEIPAVVHQYDRNEESVQLVDEIYRDKNFQLNEQFHDTKSMIEQTTSLVRANKIGAATRIFMKEYLANPDFRSYDRVLKRILEATLKKSSTQTLELLLLAVQDAMTGVKIMTDRDFFVIHKLIKREKELGYPIEPEFKKYITDFMYHVAKQDFKANNFSHCLYLTDMLNELDMPPDKDFYLFVAEVNRIAGRKDAALDAYKKALELS
ncbi:MAG: hypothetical protein IJQ85_02455 [Selenomonadaceae bacterium]|nr:hypothetical protein [Selenomonadaceae bacterium]